MAIVKKTKENGEAVYKYKEPADNILYERVASLLDTFGVYVEKQSNLELEDIDYDFALLAEALIRIDKRKDYFVIFHDETDMNEVKEAALLAYWIIKFKPFRIKNGDIEIHKKYRQINEAFAVFILYSVIKEEAERTQNMNFNISKEYNQKIMYAFKFWDLSKESIMLVAESLCEAMHNNGVNE